MSKNLYLIRHAKAEDINSSSSSKKDIKRNLTPTGINDAETMGKRLFSMRIRPEIIISSPAARALQTAKIIAQEMLMETKKIAVNKNIYDSSVHSLMKIIGETESHIKSLMLVGHNPAFNELLANLCKTNIENIPKGGIVGIKLPVTSWNKITTKCGMLLFFDSPKNK